MPNYSTALRNAQQDQITALIDAGGSPGRLSTYGGVKPATGGTAPAAISVHTFSAISGTVLNGVWTANPIATSKANSNSTITWARITDSNGNFVMDLTAGTSNAELLLDVDTTTVDLDVIINSCVITRGNQ